MTTEQMIHAADSKALSANGIVNGKKKSMALTDLLFSDLVGRMVSAEVAQYPAKNTVQDRLKSDNKMSATRKPKKGSAASKVIGHSSSVQSAALGNSAVLAGNFPAARDSQKTGAKHSTQQGTMKNADSSRVPDSRPVQMVLTPANAKEHQKAVSASAKKLVRSVSITEHSAMSSEKLLMTAGSIQKLGQKNKLSGSILNLKHQPISAKDLPVTEDDLNRYPLNIKNLPAEKTDLGTVLASRPSHVVQAQLSATVPREVIPATIKDDGESLVLLNNSEKLDGSSDITRGISQNVTMTGTTPGPVSTHAVTKAEIQLVLGNLANSRTGKKVSGDSLMMPADRARSQYEPKDQSGTTRSSPAGFPKAATTHQKSQGPAASVISESNEQGALVSGGEEKIVFGPLLMHQMSHAEQLAVFSSSRPAGTAQSVVGQVSQQLSEWMGKTSFQFEGANTKSLTMTLFPHNLGQVTVTVAQSDSGIVIHLLTSTKAAREMLSSGLDQLKADIGSQGIVLNQVDVSRQWQSHAAGETDQSGRGAPDQNPQDQADENEAQKKKKRLGKIDDGGNTTAFTNWMKGGVPAV